MTNLEYRASAKETAQKILKERGDDSEKRRHVAALPGSIGDTMSDIAVFQGLLELEATGKTFREVYATNVED
jgi:hypothetical protein